MDCRNQSGRTAADRSDETSRQAPPDLATLARRIARLSGNLLFTAVIVILGLTFGRQVLRWWSGEPVTVSVIGADADAHLDGLADPGLPHQLAFGDMSLSLKRSAFVGDQAAALARLRDECRRIALAADAQAEAEIKLDKAVLQRLASYKPVEEGEGWRMIQYAGPVITVVTLRTTPVSSADAEGETRQKIEFVLSWGLGLRAPATETAEETSSTRWTLFTCPGSSGQVTSDQQLSWPIPPGSRRTLAMQVQGGGALIGFTGQGNVSSSKEFFDQSFSARGWSQTGAWTRIGAHWHARFSQPDAGQCDVQLRDDADGGCDGMMTLQATARDSEK